MIGSPKSHPFVLITETGDHFGGPAIPFDDDLVEITGCTHWVIITRGLLLSMGYYKPKSCKKTLLSHRIPPPEVLIDLVGTKIVLVRHLRVVLVCYPG